MTTCFIAVVALLMACVLVLSLVAVLNAARERLAKSEFSELDFLNDITFVIRLWNTYDRVVAGV